MAKRRGHPADSVRIEPTGASDGVRSHAVIREGEDGIDMDVILDLDGTSTGKGKVVPLQPKEPPVK